MPAAQIRARTAFLGVATETGLAQTARVDPQSGLRVRRATVDDLGALRAVWLSLRLPADELEKRLKEFQVVEDARGNVLGAIGFELHKQYALLFGEGFSDFSIADTARRMFWRRFEALAANHGVFRIWTQESSPFWMHWGFQPADAEILGRLPEEWRTAEGKWFTLELKNEEALTAALNDKFAGFMDAEKKQTNLVREKAKVLNITLTVVGFVVFLICMAILIYRFIHRSQAGQ